MRPSLRWLRALLALAVVLAGLVVVAPAARASAESDLVSKINAARRAAGLSQYAVAGDLAAVARGQAQRMAAKQQLYHNPNLATQVTGYSWVGENVGYGPDLLQLHQAFMNSAPHRANILSTKFTQVGVGVVQSGSTVWVSEVFRRPVSLGSGSSAPAPKKKKPAPKATPTAKKPAAQPKPATTAAAPVRTSSPPAASTKSLARRSVGSHPAAPVQLPDGVTCTANVRALRGVVAALQVSRTARLVEQEQKLVVGFQCARGLPLSGVLDAATTRALAL